MSSERLIRKKGSKKAEGSNFISFTIRSERMKENLDSASLIKKARLVGLIVIPT